MILEDPHLLNHAPIQSPPHHQFYLCCSPVKEREGRSGGREGGKEGSRDGGKEGGRDEGREGGKEAGRGEGER